MNNIAFLILAAGASKRMGKPKQLLPLGEKTMLLNIVNKILTIKKQDVYVVLGANYLKIEKQLKDLVEVIVNPYWKKGIGKSIAYGVSELIHKNEYQDIMIVLADQPSVLSQDLETLIEMHKKNHASITVSSFLNYTGVPAIFHQNKFKDLIMLSEDDGAKLVIKKYDKEVNTISFNKYLLDIDTVEDYEKMLKSLHTLL